MQNQTTQKYTSSSKAPSLSSARVDSFCNAKITSRSCHITHVRKHLCMKFQL